MDENPPLFDALPPLPADAAVNQQPAEQQPWSEIKKDPQFQALSPDQKLVSFDRWHTEARSKLQTDPNWETQGPQFNEWTAKTQQELGADARAAAPGTHFLAPPVTPDEARYRIAQQAKQSDPNAQLSPDTEAAFAKGPPEEMNRNAIESGVHYALNTAREGWQTFSSLANNALSGAARMVEQGFQPGAVPDGMPDWMGGKAVGGIIKAAQDKLGLGQSREDAAEFFRSVAEYGEAGAKEKYGADPQLENSVGAKGAQFVARVAEPLIVAAIFRNPGAGMAAFVTSDRLRAYGETYNSTGSEQEAMKAANWATVGDVLFLGQAHIIAEGLGPVLEKQGITGARAWVLKASAATGGNITVSQLTSAAEAADTAQPGQRMKAFGEALTKLDIPNVALQTAFGIMAANHTGKVKDIADRVNPAYAHMKQAADEARRSSPQVAEMLDKTAKEHVTTAAQEHAVAPPEQALHVDDLTRRVQEAGAEAAKPGADPRWKTVVERLQAEQTRRQAEPAPLPFAELPGKPEGTRGVDRNVQLYEVKGGGIRKVVEPEPAPPAPPAQERMNSVQESQFKNQISNLSDDNVKAAQKALQDAPQDVTSGHKLEMVAQRLGEPAPEAAPPVEVGQAMRSIPVKQPTDDVPHGSQMDGPVVTENGKTFLDEKGQPVPQLGNTHAEVLTNVMQNPNISAETKGRFLDAFTKDSEHQFQITKPDGTTAPVDREAGQKLMATEKPLQSQDLPALRTAEVGAARRTETAKQGLFKAATKLDSEQEGKVFGKKGIFHQVQDVHFDPKNPKDWLKAIKTAVKDVGKWMKDKSHFADYYKEDMNTLRAVVDQHLPRPMKDEDFGVLRFALGATSPNTMLSTNTQYAVRIAEAWMRDGNLDSVVEGKKGVKAERGKLSLLPLHNTLMQFFGRVVKDKGSVAAAIQHFMEPVSRADLDAFHKEAGYTGDVKGYKAIQDAVEAATGQSELVPRMFAFGKKVGSYTMNHLGDYRFNTTDIWESRFIRSYFPSLFENATGLPVGDEHAMFTKFSQDFKAQWEKKYGPADNASLQALRWYYILARAKELGYRYAGTNEKISTYAENYLNARRGFAGGQLGLKLDEAASTGEAGNAAGVNGTAGVGAGVGAESGAVNERETKWHSEPLPPRPGETRQEIGVSNRRVAIEARAPELSEKAAADLHTEINSALKEALPDAAGGPAEAQERVGGGGSPIAVSIYSDGSKALHYSPRQLEGAIQESIRAGHTRDYAIRELLSHELVHWGDNTPLETAVNDGLEMAKRSPALLRQIVDRYVASSLPESARQTEIERILKPENAVQASYETVEQVSRMMEKGQVTEDMYRQLPQGIVARVKAAIMRQVRMWQGKQAYAQLTDAMKERVDRGRAMLKLLAEWDNATESQRQVAEKGAPGGPTTGETVSAAPRAPPEQSAMLNIGADKGDQKDALTAEQARAAVEQHPGVQVFGQSVQKSGTENTHVLSTNRELTPDEAHKTAADLGQEAIAQYANGKGTLHGPQVEKWGSFNENEFLNHEGKSVAEQKLFQALDQTTTPGELGGLLSRLAGARERGQATGAEARIAPALRKAVAKIGEAYSPDEQSQNTRLSDILNPNASGESVAKVLRRVAMGREATGRFSLHIGNDRGDGWLNVAKALREAADAIDSPNVKHVDFGKSVGAAPREDEGPVVSGAGFLAPNGEFHPGPKQAHEATARSILDKNPDLKAGYETGQSTQRHIMDRGYVRVTTEPGRMFIEGKPSMSQLRILKDSAIERNVELVQDIQLSKYNHGQRVIYSPGEIGAAAREEPADYASQGRQVSQEELGAIKERGRQRLEEYKGKGQATAGLEGDKWEQVKTDAFKSAQDSWGGMTIDPRTGEAFKPEKSDSGPFATTAKREGQDSVSIPEKATQEEFSAAMERAKAKFPQLADANHYLGVFHDDKLGVIDIDPVIIAKSKAEAEEIGAHTKAAGGAYDYATGTGLFPPRVAEIGAAPREGSPDINEYAKLLGLPEQAAPAPASTEAPGGIAARVAEARGVPVTSGTSADTEALQKEGRARVAAGEIAEARMAQLNADKAPASDKDIWLFRARQEQIQSESNARGEITPEELAFEKAYEPIRAEWAKTGHAMQGEVDLDTGTLLGIQRGIAQKLGRMIKPKEEIAAKKITGESQQLDTTQTANEAALKQGVSELAGKSYTDIPIERDAIAKALAEFYPQEGGKIGASPRLSVATNLPDSLKAAILKYAKTYYMTGDIWLTLKDVEEAVGSDLGMPPSHVREVFATTKSMRKISDAAYAAQAQRRMITTAAKAWIASLDRDPLAANAVKAWDSVRSLVVLGHANAPITHAGMLLFDPKAWGQMIPSIRLGLDLLLGKAWGINPDAAYETMVRGITEHPQYIERVRNGAAVSVGVDDEVAKYMISGFLGKVGIRGNMAMGVLKKLRMDRIDYLQSKMSPEQRADPATMKAMYGLVNNETGILTQGTKLARVASALQPVSFAGQLEGARWKNSVMNPVQAARLYMKGDSATMDEKYFRSHVIRQNAKIAGMMITALGFNALVNNTFGDGSDDQKINFLNPTQADWLAFKWGGQTIIAPSNFLAPLRLTLATVSAPFIKGARNDVGDRLKNYALGKAHPVITDAIELVQGKQAYTDRPLPWADDKGSSTKPALAWWEYLVAKGPIPIASTVQDTTQALIEQGVDPDMAKVITAGSIGLSSGLLGIHAHETQKSKTNKVPWDMFSEDESGKF